MGSPVDAGAARSLVIDLCRSVPAVRPEALAHLADENFRKAFFDISGELRVRGLVLVRLEQSSSFAKLPEPAAAELRDALRNLRTRAAALDLERDRAVTLLRRQAIDPVVLKGAGLRTMLYAEPVERDTSDIDLLVPENSIDAAIELLLKSRYSALPDEVAAAYRRDHFHLRLIHVLGSVVEIHWGLAEPRLPYRLDAARFLAESRMFDRRAQIPLRLPKDEHGLLHLVLQCVQERFSWFNRLVDIDRFVAAGTLDWNDVEGGARRAGLSVPLALALDLTRQMLGSDIPATTLERMRPSRAVHLHLGLLRPDEHIRTPVMTRRAAEDRLLDLWLMPDGRTRAAALARLLTVNGYVDRRHLAMGRFDRPGLTLRVLAFVKLVVCQMRLYGSSIRLFTKTASRQTKVFASSESEHETT